ncbi:MAG TPA: hypothetical protein VEW73_06775 [Nocardioides sp.]|nr:hypothetical protein [Nocardioides sp.]
MSTTARPRHRVLTAVLVTVALVGAGVVAVAVLGFCSAFGCTLFSEDFEPQGREATTARAPATTAVAQLADRVVAGHEVLADATADGCASGQNNWKRKDSYSHECSVVDSRVVLVTTDREAVADGLTAADAVLRELGCAPASPRGGLDRVREEYWTADNPQVVRYGAAGLPSATYTCAGEVSVLVEPTSDREDSTEPDIALASAFFDDELSRDWYTAEDLTTLRRSGAALALVVTVRDQYYSTRF